MERVSANATVATQVHRVVGTSDGGAEAAPREMTVESVDKVLNEIRGYLFADGGDIEVVSVDDGRVSVRFQGNCSTCSSQVRQAWLATATSNWCWPPVTLP